MKKSALRKIQLWFVLLLGFGSMVQAYAQGNPLPRAHAHNDYAHKNPLQDALKYGFNSVEADIFLVKGELICAHILPVRKKGRSLRELYLDPLQKRANENQGKIFPGHQAEFTLLIDLKQSDPALFDTLCSQIAGYPDLFSSWENGQKTTRAVQVVLTGAHPTPEKIGGGPRQFWLDSRPPDLLKPEISNDWYAWVSTRWGREFSWKGKGQMPEDELKRLRELVRLAHEKKMELRFWASPEKEKVWELLIHEQVDHINTDKLKKLSQFMNHS